MFDDHEIGGRRWPGLSPWERHPDGDELLMPLEGSYVVTLLVGDESIEVEVAAGSLLVVPRNTWHRIYAAETVTDLGIASVGEDEVSPLTIRGSSRSEAVLLVVALLLLLSVNEYAFSR